MTANSNVNTLMELLVKEFRSYQALDAATQEEKTALKTNNVQQLMRLTERKEALLDELGQLDDSRRMVVHEIGQDLGLSGPDVTLARVIGALDPTTAGRLSRLRGGISALINRIRETTRGNQAMALVAIERSDALQVFLLNLLQVPTGYRPEGVPPVNEPSVVVGINQAA